MAEKIGIREAGTGISEGHSSKSVSSNQKLFEAVREELTSIKAGCTISTLNASDLPTVIALANDMKIALNNIAAIVDKFEK